MAEKKQQMVRRDPFRSLEEWDPFRMFPFRALRARWPEDLFGEVAGNGGVIAPAIDVCETDGAYDVSIEVPGVKKDDITVECKEGVLSIHGEKRSQRDEKRSSARILERTYGAFSRSLTLPADADPDGIEAAYHDGVLQITLKKRPEAKPRSVAIKG